MPEHRLSVGLPVYNGEEYLAQSLDAILGQTFDDFELIISSNASTDATDDICREYEARDPRIRFIRQPKNIGAVPNHNAVLDEASGELFKWVSADDLYATTLFEQCIELLDRHPEAILAHSWTAAVDATGDVIHALKYPLSTDSTYAPERFRSLLRDCDEIPGAICADDFYGVFRTEQLRRIKPLGSHYHSDVTYMAELSLNGSFQQVPEWLYFRRHHPDRAFNACPTIRSWCANLDPRRADRLRNPAIRLVGEYMWEYIALVSRAPITLAERRDCYAHLAQWSASRGARRFARRPQEAHSIPTTFGDTSVVTARRIVAGQ